MAKGLGCLQLLRLWTLSLDLEATIPGPPLTTPEIFHQEPAEFSLEKRAHDDERQGDIYFKRALQSPALFRESIRKAIDYYTAAENWARFLELPELAVRIEKKKIWAEEIDGDFLFLNSIYASSFSHVLNGGLPVDWEVATADYADPVGEGILANAKQSQRLAAITANHISALQVSLKLLHEFPDQFLNSYFRDPRTEDKPRAREMIMSTLGYQQQRTQASIYKLIQWGAIDEAVELVGKLADVLLMFPSDSRPRGQLQLSTGALLDHEARAEFSDTGRIAIEKFDAFLRALTATIPTKVLLNLVDRAQINPNRFSWGSLYWMEKISHDPKVERALQIKGVRLEPMRLEWMALARSKFNAANLYSEYMSNSTRAYASGFLLRARARVVP